MRKTTAALILCLLSILTVACTSNNSEKRDQDLEKLNPPPTSKDQNETDEIEDTDKDTKAGAEDSEETIDIHLSDFFLPDGAKAHYEGEGNEFSTLDIEVNRIGNQFVVVDEDNGGVLIRKLYRIDDDKISVISEDIVRSNVDLPSEDVLNDLKPVEVYLEEPLKTGNEYNDWKIVETNAIVDTPFKKFDNAIVIEMADNGFVNRKYLVPNYGEVKRETIMQIEGDEDFIVTSSLKSVDGTSHN